MTIRSGLLWMSTGAATFLAAIALDRLAFATFQVQRAERASPAEGFICGAGLSNLALVIGCALVVFAIGAVRLRVHGQHVPDGWLAAGYGAAAFLPVLCFALALGLLRG